MKEQDLCMLNYLVLTYNIEHSIKKKEAFNS